VAKLKRTLGLFDTVSLSLGSIIGAGIFVLIGAATQMAGPALIISIVIAASIAALNGISVLQLIKKFPKEGGQYEFGYKTVSPLFGFLSGWIWNLSKIITDSVIALGFATYASFFLPLPAQVLGAAMVVLVTAINYFGIRTTGSIINLLVVIKVGVLLFFVFLGIFYIKPSNFFPFAPHGVSGILQASALMFFAYIGFVRPIYVVEEVKAPEINVPRGTFVGLILSLAIYLLVIGVAIGLVGPNVLGSTDSPMASAISATGFPHSVSIIAFGAIIATFSVLLGDVLGLSRMIFSMSRRGDYPKWFARVEESSKTPRRAVLFSGLLIGFSTLFFDLRSLAQVASFLILIYFSFAHLSATRLKGSRKSLIVPVLGIIGTLCLAFSLSHSSIAIGLLLIFLGVIYFSTKKNFY